jgi:hypothetical protein
LVVKLWCSSVWKFGENSIQSEVLGTVLSRSACTARRRVAPRHVARAHRDHPTGPNAEAAYHPKPCVQHIAQLRLFPRWTSRSHGRVAPMSPPPLAGDPSGRAATANHPVVSPIAFPVTCLPPRAPPHRRRAYLRRRVQGRGTEGMVVKESKLPGG